MINNQIWFKRINVLFLITAITITTACHRRHHVMSDALAENETDTAGIIDKEWKSLFNGKTLAGWHSYGKDSAGRAWKVEDSVLHLQADTKQGWKTSGGGDLVTNEAYTNFDLKLEWKISDAGNSGVLFYVNEDLSKYKDANESGLEMQLNDDEKNENGKVDKHRSGDLYNLIASSAQSARPAGQWNQAEIMANRGKLDFFMNGQHILSTTLWDDNWDNLIDNSSFKNSEGFGAYKKGRIALQDHGADIWFRNIMIRRM